MQQNKSWQWVACLTGRQGYSKSIIGTTTNLMGNDKMIK